MFTVGIALNLGSVRSSLTQRIQQPKSGIGCLESRLKGRGSGVGGHRSWVVSVRVFVVVSGHDSPATTGVLWVRRQ